MICTEIVFRLRSLPPLYVTLDISQNYFRCRINSDIAAAFGVNAMSPADETSKAVEILWSRLPCSDEMDAYERVLGDAMAGDATMFARQDYVEEVWRIVGLVLKENTPVYEYEQGSWGPDEVRQRVSPQGD